MKISFIIPIYNCEDCLEGCVNEINSIGLDNYEIILVNDGSSDNSGKICNQLSKLSEMIHCIHQKNLGVSAARNHGLKVANGDYIIFIDADDNIEPKKFLKLIKKIEINSSIDMAIFGLSFDYYHNGLCYRRDEMSPPLYGIQKSSLWVQKLQELYYANSLSPIWNKVIKRNIIEKNSLYFQNNMFLYEDLEYSLRCMACCDNIFFDPEIIYHYRQNENSGKRMKRIKHITFLVDKIESALVYLSDKKNIEEPMNEFMEILLMFCVVLAKEKIAVSDFKEIRNVCDEFAEWYYVKGFPQSKNGENYIRDLLRHRVLKLILKRSYIALRHKIAVGVKSSTLYKRGLTNYEN